MSGFPTVIHVMFIYTSRRSGYLNIGSGSALAIFPTKVYAHLGTHDILANPSTSSYFFECAYAASSPSQLPMLIAKAVVLTISPALVIYSDLVLP